MGKFLWKPDSERKENANITKFIEYVNKTRNLSITSYSQLYNWSVKDIPEFWHTLWDFCDIITSKGFEKVVDDLEKFPGAEWFPGAKLNFAENLLRYRDDHKAFVFKGETRKTTSITYSELYDLVGRLSAYLQEIGVTSGDFVVAYMPNMIETVVAMLAATSIGAIWASCGAELGPNAVLDRFSQIEPKVLFTVDGYFYKNKEFSTLGNAKHVVEKLPSLKSTIIASYAVENPNLDDIPNAVFLKEILASNESVDIQFKQLSFSHPVYVMFSSGTTGKPKCMIQSAGGVLINHLKELILHSDLKREDIITYITAPSWMMWNWLISSLAVGSTILLYDGNPLYPDWRTMWRLIQDEKITIFGCSASYINYLKSIGAQPIKDFDLSTLREISQTASPLDEAGFKWVYKNIKEDLHFNSISGGTDINGCFAAGSPTLPVYAGELQALALGMKVKAYDANGNAVFDQQAELVCEAPSPSMPLYFWDDPELEKYKAAYFDYYQAMDKNVWRHGDYITIHSATGGVTFYGRSDAVLKPSGVRIGTAEIYSIVEQMSEIVDSLAVGQSWKGEQRMILFVQLAEGSVLTDDLKSKIRLSLRDQASPRHVPSLIFETPNIPYTFSMKKVEVAVSNILHGKPVTNRDALSNPESLDYFEKISRKIHNE